MMERPLLDVRNLSVSFRAGRELTTPVRDVSFEVRRGERVGLVGESGSGKSLTALSLTRLVERQGGVLGRDTEIWLDGDNLMTWNEDAIRAVRGGRIGMIFQDPLTSFNPVHTIGRQISEAILTHERASTHQQAFTRTVELLESVGISNARHRADSYPYEFSGGMRQRAMIAMALASEPDLLVADEPTTALDVTTQQEILVLLDELVDSMGLAVLLITHDLGVVAGSCDRVVVMYGGRVVEGGDIDSVFDRPLHPYTTALVRSVPRPDHPRQMNLPTIEGFPPDPAALPAGCPFHPRCLVADTGPCRHVLPTLQPVGERRTVACHYPGTDTRRETVIRERAVSAQVDRPADEDLVTVDRLTKVFRRGGIGRRERVEAVQDVSFSVRAGETFAIVGESGSGKSTVARCLAYLERPTSGTVDLFGHDLSTLSQRQLRRLRRDVQMIFQDPNASLDPRWKVGRLLVEPLKVHGLWGNAGFDRSAIEQLVETVGLSPNDLDRFPHEFSGGQRQRIAIARAVALRPRLIICDEPVSALDVSIRAGVINLLMELKEQYGISYVFIAHDLAIVRHICDRVAAMHNGRIVETGTAEDFFGNAQHPYSIRLLSSEPIPVPALERDRRRSAVASMKNVRDAPA